MNRIGTWSLVLLLITAGAPGLRAQRTHTNGGATVERDGVVITKLAGHTLYIPKGYISSFVGYAGYVQIHALLPCLEPETNRNIREFNPLGYGRVLTANLDTWDSHYPEGKQILDSAIEDSKIDQNYNPKLRGYSIGPRKVDHSKFELYRNILTSKDVFTLPGTYPLFVTSCDMIPKFSASPGCYVQERIWGNVRLDYWYARSYIEADINNSLSIEARLRSLFDSFLNPEVRSTHKPETETCK